MSLGEAVVITDMALHARLICHPTLSDWIDRHAGRKGIAKARRVLEFAEDGSESPMETRLRMLLVLKGLPGLKYR